MRENDQNQVQNQFEAKVKHDSSSETSFSSSDSDINLTNKNILSNFVVSPSLAYSKKFADISSNTMKCKTFKLLKVIN